MSPTGDDLRALLAERADSGPVTEPFDASTGARLAGVRARIRQRRQARVAAGALAVALVAGSATAVTARLRQQAPAPQPAQQVELPPRDSQGRPLLARVGSERGVSGSASLSGGWRDLHLALRCADAGSGTAVAVVDGRAVGHTRCGSDGGDVTVTQDQAQAWGLRTEDATTVSLQVVPTPSAGPLRLDLPAPAGAAATLGVYATGVTLAGPGVRPAEPGVRLADLSLPMTAALGTKTVTVVTGGSSLRLGQVCRYEGGVSFAVVVTVDGRPTRLDCDTTGNATGEKAAWSSVPVRPGQPVTVGVRVTDAGGGSDAPDLVGTVPGATVGITVVGQAFLPETLQRASLLSPPQVDGQGRPLMLTLVAAAGREGVATVRVAPGGAITWRLWCTDDAAPRITLGDHATAAPCGGESSAGSARPLDVRLALDGGGPDAGAVLAVYGFGTVLRIVQQAPAAPTWQVTTTPPAPPAESGATAAGRKGVLTGWLVARGGQRISVRTGPDDQYGVAVSCSGTSARVRALVLVDGVAVAGDQAGPRPCADTVRAGMTTVEDRARSRTVELRVDGPETALVTVGVYVAALQVP